MKATQAQKPQRHMTVVDENKAFLRVIRRVVDHSPSQETRVRNKIFDLTSSLLRACHARTTELDLEAMATADIQLVLADLKTLRTHLNTHTGNLPYGQRLHFTKNMAFKKQPPQVTA